jgi:glycosyltransferase involved in cell wall biosynthesis
MKISVVVPIYNAQKILPDNYLILKEKLEDLGYDYNIIFRDDASSDKSKDILEDISKKDSKSKVFSEQHNHGLGFTLRKLFNDADGDIIVYVDIDLAFGVDILPALIEQIEKTDVTLASRYVGLPSNIPFLRRISSRLYYWMCKILFSIKTKDIGSGLVVFRRKVLEGQNLSSEGFDIHIELFAKIERGGFSIREIPVKYKYNGYSTFSVLRHGLGIFTNTLGLWLKDK